MKIKVYFVTYDNDLELNKTLRTFEDSGIKKYDYEITVINNFTVARPLIETSLAVKVVENSTRPTFSTGHLSRNWNECLIDGFVDVNNPDADIVILCQNDVEFNKDIIDTLIECHEKYSFIQSGNGDSFHSYTVDAIKSVGLWDERFCNIGWQDCDYFLRQYLYNKDCSSINDYPHGRTNNLLDYEFVNYQKLSGFHRKDINHLSSMKYHEVSMTAFIKKWGYGIPGMNWGELDITADYVLKSPQWIMYPFFESKIPNLKNKNYINYEAQN